MRDEGGENSRENERIEIIIGGGREPVMSGRICYVKVKENGSGERIDEARGPIKLSATNI